MATPTGQTGVVPGDQNFTDPDSALQRIAAIYRNRGLPLPENINELAAQVVAEGTGAIGNIRTQAENQAYGAPGGTSEQERQRLIEEMRASMGIREPLTPVQLRDYSPEWLEGELLDVYTEAWADTGNPSMAIEKVRRSPRYEQIFPGIRREDGSLRMTEADYMGHREAFRRSFTQWGLNPDMFESHHEQLVRGDVHPDEFRARLDAKISGVVQNLPQVREQYADFFGVGSLDDTSLIAAALDPDIGLELLQGRISAAQVAAEASLQGFTRSRETSERLVQAAGLDQQGARQLYSTAATAVPRASRLAERYSDPFGAFGIEQFEEAALMGNVQQQQRLRRLGAAEQARFTQGGTVARDQSGAMSGLIRR